jgi:hypothetical protein
MKKKKVKSKPKKNTYFSKIIDFIGEGIGTILMFLLGVNSNDNNSGGSSNSGSNNNNSKSTGESYQPKLERFCPRCVGKGFIDEYDVKRLGKEKYWHSGTCGFCKGTGYVERTDTRDPRLGTTGQARYYNNIWDSIWGK